MSSTNNIQLGHLNAWQNKTDATYCDDGIKAIQTFKAVLDNIIKS